MLTEDTTVVVAEARASLPANTRIKVTDPVKVGGVIPPYIVYSVSSWIIAKVECRVQRRYSDFVWLSDRLAIEYPDCVIPPLPPKQTVGRFEDHFIESRRKGLEKYMNRISTHHKLVKAKSLKQFLTIKDHNFAALQQDAAREDGTSGNWLVTGLAGWIRSTERAIEKAYQDPSPKERRKYQRPAAGAVVSQSKSTLRFSKGVDMFDEVLEEAFDVEDRYDALADKVSKVIGKQCEFSSAQSKFAQALIALGTAEEEDDELRTMLVDVGSMISSLGVLAGQYAQSDFLYLEEPIAEHAGMSTSVRKAFENRKRAKKRYLDECVEILLRKQQLQEDLQVYATGSNLVSVARLNRVQVSVKAEMEAQMKKKEQLIQNSEFLMEDYEAIQFSLAEEARNIFTDYANREIELQIKSKAAILKFLANYDPKRKAESPPSSSS